MIKRHHPLFVGERVFDCDTLYIYHIVSINPDGTIDLAMTDADIHENIIMFDCEITEKEYEYKSNNPDRLYQFAEGLVGRDGNPICYEHQTTEDDYPFFSPYLDENLFGFETWTIDEYKEEVGTELA